MSDPFKQKAPANITVLVSHRGDMTMCSDGSPPNCGAGDELVGYVRRDLTTFDVMRAARAAVALQAALPVMRRTVHEWLESYTVDRDPATVTPDEWAEIDADIHAIWKAAGIVDPPPDVEGVDTAWLDAALAYREQQLDGET